MVSCAGRDETFDWKCRSESMKLRQRRRAFCAGVPLENQPTMAILSTGSKRVRISGGGRPEMSKGEAVRTDNNEATGMSPWEKGQNCTRLPSLRYLQGTDLACSGRQPLHQPISPYVKSRSLKLGLRVRTLMQGTRKSRRTSCSDTSDLHNASFLSTVP